MRREEIDEIIQIVAVSDVQLTDSTKPSLLYPTDIYLLSAYIGIVSINHFYIRNL